MKGTESPGAVLRSVDPAEGSPTSRAALVEVVREQVASARYRAEAESVAEALLSWSLAGPDARSDHLARAS